MIDTRLAVLVLALLLCVLAWGAFTVLDLLVGRRVAAAIMVTPAVAGGLVRFWRAA